MRRMDWDTRRPGNVSRRIGSLVVVEAYIHKHYDDGVHNDDPCGTPKEHSVLRIGISRLSAAKKF